MFTLRNYQQKIIDKTRHYLRQGHKSIVVQAPTGSGKTVIFSYIVKNALNKNSKVLIITDRIELLTETGGTLNEFGINYTEITAGRVYPPDEKCVIGMSQTMRRRIPKPDSKHRYPKAWAKFFANFDLVIIDECHKQEFNDFFTCGKQNADALTGGKQGGDALTGGKHDAETESAGAIFNGATILGFSATPVRYGKARQLAEDYSQIVHGPTTQELIDLGYLKPDNYYFARTIETKGLKKNSRGDDFAETDMFQRFNKPELYGDAIKAWKQHTSNTITLVFTVNIQHAVETCKAFNDAGIKAKFLTSPVKRPTLPDNPTPGQQSRYEKHKAEYDNWKASFDLYSGNRDDVVSQWKDGQFYVLVNAGILTTGFNFPAIETIQVLRVSMSDPLWLQMIGRGSRPYIGIHPITKKQHEKSSFNIIDHGNHGARLGTYRTPRKYDLLHEQKDGGGVAPVKECGAKKRPGVKQDPVTGYYPDRDNRPGCGAYINASVLICPYCGYKYETDKEIVEAEFQKYEYDITPAPNAAIKQLDEIDLILQEAEQKGYKEGWAMHRVAAKHGFSGLQKLAEKKNYKRGWVYKTARRMRIEIPKSVVS